MLRPRLLEELRDYWRRLQPQPKTYLFPSKDPRQKRDVPMHEGVREGSKTEEVLGLIKRPGGAPMKELMKATGWLPHSVRGFLSGTVGKKMGLAVTSTKGKDGQRSYSLKA